MNQPITLDEDGYTAPLRLLLQVLKNDHVVGIFPEGRAQRGDRELNEFQPGIGLLAKRSKAMVVPVWIDGTPQTKHMIWHFLKPSRSTVIFGQAYRPDASMTHEEVALDLRRRMLELIQQIEDEPL